VYDRIRQGRQRRILAHSGKIVAVNDELNKRPELVNESPEKDAWIAEIEIIDANETKNLMTAEDYKKFVAGLS
jgi:glycine cleavage system H protein